MVSVLVVDDESDIREAVSEVLADEGYVVHGAGDGAEALRKARAVHPNIVLLDLMMPGMNGWEFRAAQKGDPELSDIPVVVLSALGRVAGMDAARFIQKPFDLDELLDAVRQYADGHVGGRVDGPHAPM
ncbi:response regulator transcription factor [Anaeromyxobacter sp. Fw109-5]|uniref:response regulator transcription factor n=1 Tax=Anaeromyxobacter sp. (strain Fw109-5) TaxID=404589 RepID=UPI0000ED6E05|nr:response regulator [Anaeromyxobacter sp. Fw109-5]ABS28134.1 response regulator receiver protein [Anaeromyxobacter sp. Fw109-5]